MTKQQALRQARKMWGKRAFVEDRGTRAYAKNQLKSAFSYLTIGLRNLHSGKHWSHVRYCLVNFRVAANCVQGPRRVGEIDNVIGGFHIYGSGWSWVEAFENVSEHHK